MAFCFSTVFVATRSWEKGRDLVNTADFTLKISILGKRFFCQFQNCDIIYPLKLLVQAQASKASYRFEDLDSHYFSPAA